MILPFDFVFVLQTHYIDSCHTRNSLIVISYVLFLLV